MGQDRRVVTFGTFLILFAIYLSNLLRKLNIKMITLIIQIRDFYLHRKIVKQRDIEEKLGLPVKEFIKIEAYKNCNHSN